MNTTRSYPRTMNEAFKNTAEYGCAIERPATRRAETAVKLTLWLAVLAIFLSIVFQGPLK